MKFAGLNQPPTEIECFSTVRAVDSTEDNVAIIDIGANATNCTSLTRTADANSSSQSRWSNRYTTDCGSDETTFEEAELKNKLFRALILISERYKRHIVPMIDVPVDQVIKEYERINNVLSIQSI